ncbi:CARDB domain-containing protein [Corallococcus sp. 4LFB]|uniref:CARDB domain-containing protein n=1 Tax=Corallococcus sp. 4LFB TaxID=3383249 RepID=UPI003975CF73
MYLSTTPTQQVPAPDSPPTSEQVTVGEVDVGPVDPGACVTSTVSGYAMSPPSQTPTTALYLGASVDTGQQVQELNETNNGFVRGLMGVGNGADLVVTEVKAPANVRDATGFLADVRVCNVGTQVASSTQAEIFLSTQATLSIPGPGSPSLSQVKVGEAFVPLLDAGGCILVRAQATAQRPPDAYLPTQPLYVGAIVDAAGYEPELREDNNAYVAGRMGVGTGADLVVTDVVGSSSFRQGAQASTSATVCNVGTEFSSQATVAVRLATQPSLTPAPQNPSPTTETDLGATQTLMGLDAGQCTTVKLSGTSFAPSSWQPGAPLYLGATVSGSPYEPELREDNNTFVKGLVGLGNGPDLVVRSLKAPANVAPYGSFPVEARVCNVGTEYVGGSTHLELFLSTQDAVDFPTQLWPTSTRTQVPVGGTTVSFLEAGQCTTVPVNAHASLPSDARPGQALFLGAAIDTDRMTQELREDNNVFTQGRVGVGTAPDLVVTDVEAPANLRDGQSFTASYTVCNVGLDPVPDHGVSLFLSLDAAPPVLEPSQYTNPVPGYGFQGHVTSSAPLNPRQCVTRSATFQAMRPYPAGPALIPETWNLSAVVTTQAQETRVDNNGFAAGLVGMGNGPDLVVAELQGPASARQNETFTTRVKVCNVGTQAMNNTVPVEVYLSTEDVLQAPSSQGGPPPSNDTRSFVGLLDVPPLDAGACLTQDLSGQATRPYSAPPSQPLYLGAIVDPYALMQELREDNNTRVAGVMSVGSGPDLSITSLEAPDTVAPSESFAASARVCNVGTEPSNYAQVVFIVSTDETWNLPAQETPAPFPAPNQFILAEGTVGALQAGQCTNLTRTMSSMFPPGASPEQPVYLSAVVNPNPGQPELRHDNNVHVGRRLGIGNGPDLVATALTAPSGVLPGLPFTATVTVCNQGAQPTSSGTRATLHLLTTPSLPQPSPGAPPPPYEELLADVSLPQVGAHACVTFPVEAFVHGGGPGMEGQLFHVGITLDPNATLGEVREDNNTFISPERMAVGAAPDLVITAMGGPASVQQSSAMTVPVTVCNQGTMPSMSRTVSIVISTEPTLSQAPWYGGSIESSPSVARLGIVEIPALPVNACATREESFQVALPQGASPSAAFFLGAAVDGAGYLDELRTDNDTFVRGRIGVGNAPDLVVTQVTAPFSVRRGELFTTQVTICNQGTSDLDWSSQVELILSTQSTLSLPGAGTLTSQVSLGSLTVDALGARQCTTRSLSTSAYSLPDGQGSGLFYLGALVDSQQSVMELREDNNAFVEGFLAVLP